MLPKTNALILDRYLLHNDVSDNELRLYLVHLQKSPLGVIQGIKELPIDISDDELPSLDALIDVRVTLSGDPPPHNPLVIAKLKRICSASRLIDSFIRGELKRSQFSIQLNQFGRTYRNEVHNYYAQSEILNVDEVDLMFLALSEKLSLISGDPECKVDQSDVLNECIRTNLRLSKYWSAVLRG